VVSVDTTNGNKNNLGLPAPQNLTNSVPANHWQELFEGGFGGLVSVHMKGVCEGERSIKSHVHNCFRKHRREGEETRCGGGGV